MCAACGRCAGAARRDIMQAAQTQRDAIRTGAGRGAMTSAAPRVVWCLELDRFHVPPHPTSRGGERKNGGRLRADPIRYHSQPFQSTGELFTEKENEMPSVFQEVVYHDVFYMPLQNGFFGRFTVNVAKVEGGYYGDIICSAFLDGKHIPQTATSCAAYGKSKMGVVSRLQECIPGMIPKTADAIKESHEAGYW